MSMRALAWLVLGTAAACAACGSEPPEVASGPAESTRPSSATATGLAGRAVAGSGQSTAAGASGTAGLGTAGTPAAHDGGSIAVGTAGASGAAGASGSAGDGISVEPVGGSAGIPYRGAGSGGSGVLGPSGGVGGAGAGGAGGNVAAGTAGSSDAECRGQFCFDVFECWLWIGPGCGYTECRDFTCK